MLAANHDQSPAIMQRHADVIARYNIKMKLSNCTKYILNFQMAKAISRFKCSQTTFITNARTIQTN